MITPSQILTAKPITIGDNQLELVESTSAPTTEYGAPDLGIASSRCPAAHRDDPTRCNGPVAVKVRDGQGGAAPGCEHHAARLLASLEHGGVYPLPSTPDGIAIAVYKAARHIRPFPWVEGGPHCLSRAEVYGCRDDCPLCADDRLAEEARSRG